MLIDAVVLEFAYFPQIAIPFFHNQLVCLFCYMSERECACACVCARAAVSLCLNFAEWAIDYGHVQFSL